MVNKKYDTIKISLLLSSREDFGEFMEINLTGFCLHKHFTQNIVFNPISVYKSGNSCMWWISASFRCLLSGRTCKSGRVTLAVRNSSRQLQRERLRASNAPSHVHVLALMLTTQSSSWIIKCVYFL